MDDPEVWRPVVDAPGYDVSNMGRIRSWRTAVWLGPGKVYPAVRTEPMILKATAVKSGHLVWGASDPDRPGKALQKKVHQTVLEAFVGPKPAGKVTRHLNGDPADNRLWNLAWGTQKENREDRIRHGRNNDGPNNNTSKLTWEQVREIRSSTSTISGMADKYGVASSTIRMILKGLTWKDDPNGAYDPTQGLRRRVLNGELPCIEDGCDNKVWARKFCRGCYDRKRRAGVLSIEQHHCRKFAAKIEITILITDLETAETPVAVG